MRARPAELPFPLQTYRHRLHRLQSALGEQALSGALLFDPENIYWLCGYQSIGYFTFQCLFVPAEGGPALVSRRVNGFLASVTPTLERFVQIDDTDEPTEVLARFLLSALPAQARLGVETGAWYLTVQDFQSLQARMPEVRLEAWSGYIERQRVRKTGEELDRIRAAARTAVAGLDAALRELGPGKTDNDIAAAMYGANIRAGGEYLGHAPLVVTGPRTALCFALWRRERIEPGDVVLLEAGGCVDRYHAMIARSAVVGDPSPQQARVARTLIDALEAAIEAIAPGRTSGQVDAACRRVVEAAGLGRAFTHRAAYSVGIGFPPNWAEGKTLSIRPDDRTVLEPGMTFHVVPTLFFEEFGMCFSETVLVTDDGREVLTDYPRRLFTTEGRAAP